MTAHVDLDAIRAIGLVKRFGDQVAVKGLDLTVANGERSRCSARTGRAGR